MILMDANFRKGMKRYVHGGLRVGRCGVAKLQMKVGHLDGMHCFIDGTSILVKI
jgi:hypothetical protein